MTLIKQVVTKKIWTALVIWSALSILAICQSAVAQTNTFPSTGNVGVGTTSPGKLLTVNGDAGITTLYGNSTSQNANDLLKLGPGSNGNFFIDNTGAGGFAQTIIGFNTTKTAGANGVFSIFNNSTDRNLLFMAQSAGTGAGSNQVIFPTGHVGIGTTTIPTFYHTTTGLQLGGNANFQFHTVRGAGNASNWFQNGYVDEATSNYKYISSDFMTNIAQYNGAINFLTAPSGTADTIATLTNRMVIGNTGNVGIGTTTPGKKLEILATDGEAVRLYRNANNVGWGVNMKFAFNNSNNAQVDYAGVHGVTEATTAGAEQGQLWFTTATSGSLTPKMMINASGNVGIGTNTPDQYARLHISGSGGFGQDIQTTSGDWVRFRFVTPTRTLGWFLDGGGAGIGQGKFGLYDYTAGQWRLGVDTSGNVGIGTITPAYKLDVAGAINAAGLNINGSPVTSSQWSTSGTTINYGAGNVGIGTSTPGSKLDVTGNINASGTINAVGGLNINGSPVTSSQWSTSGTTINYGAGNVGIGTTTPGYKLDVNGTVNATGVNVNGSPITSSQWTTSGSNINYATSGGNVGVGQPSPAYKLDVNGTAHVSGNLTVDGNLAAKYQDVAEWVPASEQLTTGTVVVLDSTKSNQVISSTVSYDTRVAGVVSEQPGIALGERSANKVLVATTGRVRVKVDATRAPIQVGDLLVTSDIPGVAMKSEPVNLGGVQLHRPGTLIGKALEPWAKGSGEILVLLSLQ